MLLLITATTLAMAFDALLISNPFLNIILSI